MTIFLISFDLYTYISSPLFLARDRKYRSQIVLYLFIISFSFSQRLPKSISVLILHNTYFIWYCSILFSVFLPLWIILLFLLLIERPQEAPSGNPCVPSPCGPNSQCRPIGNTPACSCSPNYVGRPPNCRPECTINTECPGNLACQNERCRDPCPGSCGPQATCQVVKHNPQCSCLPGYTGDPFAGCSLIQQSKAFFFSLYILNLNLFSYYLVFTIVYISLLLYLSILPNTFFFSFFLVTPTEGPRMPCNPSPCGANAVCKERNGAGSCSCLPEYFGDPYSGCRPECVTNSDCDRTRACMNNKCKDPCPGTCGLNAECRVINHAPSCSCLPGYSGDPLSSCKLTQASKTCY